MSDFDIFPVVADIGETVTICGVTSSLNIYGDDIPTYTAYVMSGVVQVNMGDEQERNEGLVQQGDITVFIDSDEPNTNQLVTDNHIVITVTMSGIFMISNVITNKGHFEVHAEKINEYTP